MIRTQIQLTEDQARALKDMASSRHLSVAELIRRAIDSLLKTSTSADPKERLRRALEIAGKFRSGKRDISRKHDVYLSEGYDK
jgi:hypothetical protein